MRTNKYLYLSVLQGNYGFGWDDLYFCYDNDAEEQKALKRELREYRKNEPGIPHRIVRRREPNPDYVGK